jgi:hypothetical protein
VIPGQSSENVSGKAAQSRAARRWAAALTGALAGALTGAVLMVGSATPAHAENDPLGKASNPAASATAAPALALSLEAVTERLNAQEQEIEALREALREQQALTASLEAKLGASAPLTASVAAATPVSAQPVSFASASPASATAGVAANPGAVAANPDDLAQKVAQLETDLRNDRRSFNERLKNFGPFAFSGDLRLRAEPTFGGPVDQSQDRFRERVRLRFNVDARLNDQINGGFSLASGDLNDPISTNQTLNQFDTRKPIAIDKAWATYNPGWFRPLTLTGGKFAYSWFNTELVWDKDLNPEGASETLAFHTETPLLQKIAVVGFQLPFAENKNTLSTNKSYYNTMVYGEQLQSSWQFGSRVRFSAYASYYDWRYADSVPFALLVPNSASPADGLLALKGAGEVNSIATVTATNAITGAKTITSAQFASKFGIVDTLAQLDIATPSERWPIGFVADFADNALACTNVGHLATGAVLTVPCDPRARHGYWLEANAGRTVKKGDWQLSYSRIVIQREAVVGTFNYSEIFPSSDVEIHRPEVMYQLFDNVTLQLNGLFGRPLADAGTKGAVQPLWERLQFDMTYKF